MARLIYLTHPQVEIDPAVPVPDWGLSAVGAARVADAVARGVFAGIAHVVSSAERKAVETARPIAAPLKLTVEVRAAMHENDRSATGFLPGPEFEATADEFFARPTDSVRGWERAIDAQARIVAEVTAVRAAHPDDVLCVGHGGVGTLLLCHLDGRAIDRRHDQRGGGGGNLFVWDRGAERLIRDWTPLEHMPSGV